MGEALKWLEAESDRLEKECNENNNAYKTVNHSFLEGFNYALLNAQNLEQLQLDDKQQIVLDWLKEAVRSGEYEPMHAISHLHTHVNLPTHYNESPYKEYYTLNPIGEIRVLMAFAQWRLGQEEAE